MPIHERIDGANLVMFADHPEKLPSLHQDVGVRQLALLRMHLQRQRSFQLCLESKEQFCVERREALTVGELPKGGS